tara:strand:+ start:466 stop:672 length:207 start_codon:yes stop_codon:yes gene_type:complete
MTQTVPRIEKRKLIISGNSVVLTVPKDWLIENELKAGDNVLMIANGDLTFSKIDQEKIENLRKRLIEK